MLRTLPLRTLLLATVAATLPACTGAAADATASPTEDTAMTPDDTTPEPSASQPAGADVSNGAAASATRQLATFGAGCFWCVEAVLEQYDGVLDVRAGYMGGSADDPSYEQICTGTTGHAEVVQVAFDPSEISYEQLLSLFWKLHDPTTLNRQGGDSGTQYRSAIFYHSEEQQTLAKASLGAADASGEHPTPIVTEITAASEFFEADAHHQDYYRNNREQGYCRLVIAPKLDKLGLDK